MAKTTKPETAKSPSSKVAEKKRTVVPFFYRKCADFRTVHVDGAIGGPTPRGLIHVAIYSERPAIPRRIDIEVTADGSVGQEVKRNGKNGVLRELQCDLVMDLNAAKSLSDWLTRNIAMLEQAISKQKRELDANSGEGKHN